MGRSVGRQRLASVLQQAKDLVTVGDVEGTLGVSRQEAAKILWRWSRQGLLRRLRRGLYAPVPLGTTSPRRLLVGSWALVPKVFGPAYIGGWSAAEHWDLTEQMFRSILVFTSRPARPRKQTIQGIPYVLKRVRPDRVFGTRTVWCDGVKVPFSDVHRTVVDMLDDPGVGGGIQHSFDCLRNHLRSEQADVARLIECADRLGNGAVFKRLGFLLSRLDADEGFLESCSSRLTAGNAKLDPVLTCRRLVTRWRLWIPETWEEMSVDDRP